MAVEGQENVGSRLSALLAKIDHLSAPGTDRTLRQIGSLCIRIAMYSLGGLARPGTRKMESLLNLSTSQFEEEDVLRDDGRSDVFKVRHRATGKTFVMKELVLVQQQEAAAAAAEEEEEQEQDDQEELRLLREACFMAACGGHPSLVRFYAVARCPATGHCCLVMEHVGPSLQEIFFDQRRGRPFPEQDVRCIIRQVLSGAKAMHDRGIVHGAINPDNVLAADGGSGLFVVKIGGSGQATSADGNTRWYRAPEAVLLPGRPPAAGADGNVVAIDSWSIGCLMADLVTGKALFEVPGDEKRQLYEIFRWLGFPADEETIQAIKLPDQDPRLAQDVRAMQSTTTKQHNLQLRELVRPEVLSDDGFEVLSGLLTCNPKKRLTPAAALQLPWFLLDDDQVHFWNLFSSP